MENTISSEPQLPMDQLSLKCKNSCRSARELTWNPQTAGCVASTCNLKLSGLAHNFQRPCISNTILVASSHILHLTLHSFSGNLVEI